MEFWNEPEIGSLPLPPSHARRYKSVVESGWRRKNCFFFVKRYKRGGGKRDKCCSLFPLLLGVI